MKNIVVITGAGISAESGIKTFRDTNGFWGSFKIENVATPSAWEKNPAFVQVFYNLRRKEILDANANAAHSFLTTLQQKYDVQVITQNIDDLHERAGNKNVLHLHGNIRFAKSSGSETEKKLYPINGWELKMTDMCDDGFQLRPHVVWFGEEVPNLNIAAELCSTADILLLIGTSLNVYPAASLIHCGKKDCLKIAIDPKIDELNLDSSFIKINKTAVEAISDLENILL